MEITDLELIACRGLCMRILLAHNDYQQPGGEDAVFEAERALLESAGHDVVTYRRHNDDVTGISRPRLLARAHWSRSAYRDMRHLIREHRPDVAHFHNTLPLISPSAYYACAQAGVGVVQTLHNYRLLCVNGLLLRQGRVCESCVSRRFAWPGIAHACYRGSASASAAVASMTAVHAVMGTWASAVDTYIALTEFGRGVFVRGGLPAERIVVKPNFLAPDPGPGSHEGSFALFVGRLSEEKGIRTLLDAWRRLGGKMELRIAGDGPLRSLAEPSVPGVRWLGPQARSDVLRLMGEARVLIFPSECYEGMPLTIVEAFARGLPVLASRLGAMMELVAPEVTGSHFEPGNADDLAANALRLWERPGALERMGRAARAEYESRFTPRANLAALERIYENACRRPDRDARRSNQSGASITSARLPSPRPRPLDVSS